MLVDLEHASNDVWSYTLEQIWPSVEFLEVIGCLYGVVHVTTSDGFSFAPCLTNSRALSTFLSLNLVILINSNPSYLTPSVVGHRQNINHRSGPAHVFSSKHPSKLSYPPQPCFSSGMLWREAQPHSTRVNTNRWFITASSRL